MNIILIHVHGQSEFKWLVMGQNLRASWFSSLYSCNCILCRFRVTEYTVNLGRFWPCTAYMFICIVWIWLILDIWVLFNSGSGSLHLILISIDRVLVNTILYSSTNVYFWSMSCKSSANTIVLVLLVVYRYITWTLVHVWK